MKILLLPLGIVLLLVSCSGKPDLSTPEKFADVVISSINAKDTARFNALFMNEEDFAYVLKHSTEPGKVKRQMAAGKARFLDEMKAGAALSYEQLTGGISGISTFQLSPFEVETNDAIDLIYGLEIQIETPDHHKKMIRIGRIVHVNKQWKAVAPIDLDEVY